MSDDIPDISRLDEGDDVRVYYYSRRSGNEVHRDGEVAFWTLSESRGYLYWVNTDRRGPLKYQYVVLSPAETEGGDDVVLAHSVTVAAESPTDDQPPKPGRAFSVTFSVNRQSYLGVVDRVMCDGININYRG